MSKKLIKNIYFVNIGERTGQFLNIIDYNTDKKTYSILTFPETEAIYVTENDLNTCIMNKIIDFVETIPEDIYEECKKEFTYRTSLINN